MKSIKDDIKNRDKLTKYLEYIFIKKDYEAYNRNKSSANDPDKILDEKWYASTAKITRTWLNYLNNDQFNTILKKNINEKVNNKNTKGEKDSN